MGGAGATAGVGGGASCEGTCVDIPAGWQGLVTRVEGTSTPACPSAYGIEVTKLHNGLVAPAACSKCDCTPVCKPSITIYSDQGCGGNGSAIPTVKLDQCTQSGVSGASVHVVADSECTTTVSTPTAPSWDKEVALCAPSVAGGCTQGTCVPKGGNPACVYKSGDVSCPTGWENRTLDHDDFADSRTCSQCQCSASGCGIDVAFGNGNFCTAGNCATGDPNGKCCSIAATASYNAHVGGAPSCQSAGGNLTGAATPTGPVTVCCR